jgi:hypothetical protein
MKHNKEFDTSYFHNPIVQGVNYSIFIMLLKEMVSMEYKGQPGAALAVTRVCPLGSVTLVHLIYIWIKAHRNIGPR